MCAQIDVKSDVITIDAYDDTAEGMCMFMHCACVCVCVRVCVYVLCRFY